MASVVAIHQPNFLPWLGYFDKIARSDVFVFLDDAQFQKTGGVWSNRVKLLIGGEARWVTAPIVRAFHGVRLVNQIEFQPNAPWREKLLKTLATNYARAPFFSETIEWLEPLIRNPENNLSRYNTMAVTSIAERVGISTARCRWSSHMDLAQYSNERLVAITRAVGGDTYMCGGGATGYHDDATFAAGHVDVVPQQFQHPRYPQDAATEFVPGLSVVDALMNGGVALVSRWFVPGNRASMSECR
jgi:WbqC-like protein family